MKITATPRSRAWRMYLRTTPACFTPSADVGRAGDRERLPLAARERADRLVGVADVDPHRVELLTHRLARGLRVEEAQRPDVPHRLGAEEEVPPDRHQGHHREVLVDGRD